MSADRPAVAGGKPVREKNLPYGFHSIGQAEERELLDTLRHGYLTFGPKTLAFEKEFAAAAGAKEAVAVSSATAALHVSLAALGLGPGDEVITSPLTFVATANAIAYTGATPVFADIDPATFNIDPAQVERRVTRRTRAILPVHYAGQPCDMDALLALAKRRRLRVVEDASHAAGALYKGRHVGSLGDLTCFSFHPVKNMTTAEGGMITTADPKLAATCRALRLHGFAEDYMSRAKKGQFHYPRMQMLGFKCVMTDLQASLGLHQLRRLEEFTRRRNELARAYEKAFAGVPELRTPRTMPGVRHAWHIYVVRLDLKRLSCTRDQFIDALKKENVTASVHYLPVHRHPYYAKRYGFRKGDYPEAERAYEENVSLPMFPRMSDRDLADAARAVTRLVAHYRKR